MFYFFFFKQKTAYEIYQCDWSSDVCSSDLNLRNAELLADALLDFYRERLPLADKKRNTYHKSFILRLQYAGFIQNYLYRTADRSGEWLVRHALRNKDEKKNESESPFHRLIEGTKKLPLCVGFEINNLIYDAMERISINHHDKYITRPNILYAANMAKEMLDRKSVL